MVSDIKFKLKENRPEFGLGRLNPEVRADEKLADVLIRIFQDPMLESKYYDFLRANSSLENLYFVLDMNAFKKKVVSPEIYRVYFALVYIMTNAPLSLNVDSEVKSKIISTLTGSKGVDPSIFDDAFHEAYWSLKIVTDSFIKKNPFLGNLNPVKNASFRLNLKETISIMELILTDSNVTFKKISEKTISGFIASATILDKLAIDRHQILSKVQNRFFENKKDIDSYYCDHTVDKVALVDKNYKLKKKFGEQPSQKDLLRQVPASFIFKSEENMYDVSEEEEDTRAAMIRRSNRLNSFFGEIVTAQLIKSQVEDGSKKTSDELDKIRRKWDKLQSVLGGKLPLKYMIAQKSSNSEILQPERLFCIYQVTLQTMNNAIEDVTQLIEILHNFSSLDFRRDKVPDDQIPKRRVSIEVTVNKGIQTERKVIKLENILGSDIGVTSLLRQVRNQIVNDIETLITNDITDHSQRQILEMEIEKTRTQIDSKIENISTSCTIVDETNH